MPAIIRNGHIYSASPAFPINAENVNYDNTDSELQAVDVQDAIDELKELVDQSGGTDTTYSLSVGTGADANKIVLTPSTGNPDKITVPYATNAGTVNSHTVASDVPANAVFTDNNTTYGLSVGTGTDANKIILTPSTGTADTITVPYATNAGTVNGKTVAENVPSGAVFTDTTDAASLTYSNTTSGLSATKVQNAIDELSSEKKDEYTTITYAQWQQLTPTQQAEKDYYISDYPSSAITAGNVNYNNTTSGMSANNVQGAVDELKSGLIDINGNLANKEPLGGTATGNKTFYVGDKLYFKTDGEGGNIIIKSPTNIAYEADAYNGSFRFRTTKSGTGKSITWDGLEAISLNDLKKYKVDGKLIQYLGSTNTIIDVSNVTNLATLSVGNYQDAAIFMIYKESGTSIFIQKLAGSSTLSLTYSESNKLVLHNDNPAGGCAMLTYSTSF